MSHTRRTPATIFLTLFFAAAVLAGCGSDDDSSDGPAGDAAAQTTSADDGADADDEATKGGFTDENAPWRNSETELDAIAFGLEGAMMAERVEVDGNTVHIYLEDGARVPGGGCTVAMATLPDDATAVIHQNGEETTC